MRILLSQAQISARKREQKIKKFAKLQRAICRESDAWHTELMSLPLDARISKVSHHIARGAEYSLCQDDIRLSVSRNSVVGLPGLANDCVVLLTKGGEALDAQIFNSSTKAATHFLTLLQAFRPTDIEVIPQEKGFPIGQFTQVSANRSENQKVFEKL